MQLVELKRDGNKENEKGIAEQQMTTPAPHTDRQRPLTCTLGGWLDRPYTRVLYDSDAEEFTNDGLFAAVVGKPDVAVVAVTTAGDVFGGAVRLPALRQDRRVFDAGVFLFSFEAHGRCATPRQIHARPGEADWLYACFRRANNDGWFVEFYVSGYGGLALGNEASETYCYRLSSGFADISDTALSGGTMTEDVYSEGPEVYRHSMFFCARLIVVQGCA